MVTRVRLLTTTVACAAILGVAAAQATACTCVDTRPAERLAGAEVGFVGTVVGSRPVEPEPVPGFGNRVYVLRVERVYKGSLPPEVDVTIGGSGNSCGFRPAVGTRLGLLLYGRPPYRAGICHLIAEEDLERAVRPPAPARGRGRVALLAAGRFGERTRVAALDRRGLVIAYGFGRAGTALSVCPGSRRFVQAGDSLVVRRVRDLRAVSRTRLSAAAADVRCLDPSGRTVVLLAHAGRGGTARAVALLQRGRARVLARGLLPHASLGRRRAVVTSGLEGDVRVSAVDYASGRTRPLLRMADPPWGLALDPGERLLALSATDPGSLVSGPRPRVLVKDLRTGRLRSRAVDDLRPGQCCGCPPGASR
jgi:hypothetical protein